MEKDARASKLRLADFLRSEQEAILTDWEDADRRFASARNLPTAELRDNIPIILNDIADLAEKANAGRKHGSIPLEHPQGHAQQRLSLNFSLEEVTREYALLRAVILHRLSPRVGELDVGELLLLNEALDQAIIEAVAAFVAGSTRTLEAQRERLQVTLKCIADGVVSTDSQGRISYMNPAAEQLTGWSCTEAQGRRIDEVLTVLAPGTQRPVRRVLNVGAPYSPTTDTVLQRRDGALVPVEEITAPLLSSATELMGTVVILRDVSKTRALTAELSHRATHDPLTGLPNRTLLLDRVAREVAYAERHNGRLALLYLDLDRFKYINDTLGHQVGDELLKAVARRLEQCVRRTDTVSRIGGDEFTVLLTELDEPARLREVAEQLVGQIAAPFRIGSHQIHTSSSIGISVFPEDGRDPETLTKHADVAMYHAKEHGRNTFQFFIPEFNRRASERRSLESDLRAALEQAALTLNFQPVIDLKSGRIVGAEALLRWNHPDLGPISPNRFIPVAEDSGLIIAVGDWALEQACRQAQSWREAGLPAVRIAVNVSPVQFRRERIADRVGEVLQSTGLPAECLELEITESVLLSATTTTAGVIDQLKDLGVRLSVDDFGTGYSSLSYLKRLPVDDLKIDRTFVRDITTDPNDAAIVQAIIRMAHSLALGVIAEGAESQEAVDFLTANDCDLVQGHHFSRPVSAGQFEQLLRDTMGPPPQ